MIQISEAELKTIIDLLEAEREAGEYTNQAIWARGNWAIARLKALLEEGGESCGCPNDVGG